MALEDTLARVGVDEFAVVLTALDSGERQEEVVVRIGIEASRPIALAAGRVVQVGVSLACAGLFRRRWRSRNAVRDGRSSDGQALMAWLALPAPAGF